jgi:hypothetical protein
MAATTATSTVRTAPGLFPGPLPASGRGCVPGSSQPPMPRCWRPAPCTHPTRRSKRPKRPWWTPPAGSTRPGCARWSATLRPPWILTGLTRKPNAALPAGDGVTTTYDRMVAVGGILDPKPARPCRPRWSRWPARPTTTTPAAGANAALMPSLSWSAGSWRPAGCRSPVGPPQLRGSIDRPSLNRLNRREGRAGSRRAGWVERPAGPDPWNPRRAGGWPVTPPAPRSWSAANPGRRCPLPQRHPRRPVSSRPGGMAAGGAGHPPPALGGPPRRPLDVGRATRVVTRPNAKPWPCGTAAVSSPGCSRPLVWWEGHHVGGLGWMAAPPTWTIWPWWVGPIIGPCMRTAHPRPRRPGHHHHHPTTPNTGPPDQSGDGRVSGPSQ